MPSPGGRDSTGGSRVRITGGILKGRKLDAPKGLDTRPTSGKLRESLFGIIGREISGGRVLDLFCGVGTLGVEALSRGAKEAVFVEKSEAALKFLRKNLSSLGILESSRVVRSDSTDFLESPASGERFSLVLADPPYSLGIGSDIISLLGELPVLEPGGLFVFQHSKLEDLPRSSGRLVLVRERRFGESVFSIYRAAVKEEK